MTYTFKLHMSEEEQTLLFWNVPNELINGFRVHNFENCIGVPEAEYAELSKELRANPVKQEQLSRTEGLVLRNALDAVLQELGEAEFQTRTGIDYHDGCELLSRFDSNLHLPASS